MDVLDFLEDIVDFFSMLIDFVVEVIDFAITLVTDLVYVVGLLAEFVVKIPTMFGWLPTTCLALLVFTFSIVVIYKVVGREG